MKQVTVKVERDHIERITGAKPLVALCELIWNAYDADAHEVRVDLEYGALGRLEWITVEDDGDGIPPTSAEAFFSSIGGSWKKAKPRSTGGRVIHGSSGEGRFKAFALGSDVVWRSQSQGEDFDIHANATNLETFSISDSKRTKGHGCSVTIRNILKDFEIASDEFAGRVRDVFALQLYEDPNFSVIFNGIRLDAKGAIAKITPIPLLVPDGSGTGIAGELEIVEWRQQVDRVLLLCRPGRFPFYTMPPGIHARGFEFTAYLTSDYFGDLAAENREGLVELDPTATTLIDSAKDKLREHFRSRDLDRSRDKIQEWKDTKLYPYASAPASAIERNEQQVFDAVALSLADYSIEFERAPEKQQKLILRLLRLAVESGPSSLPGILEHVVDLPKAKQEELAELLRKTTLVAVINAAKAVTDRLDFLRALQLLIFDSRSKKQLLERSQLHRILAKETWIFGEQFNLTNDDEDLTSVLLAHLHLLGRTELTQKQPVLDADGNAAIVDLMLSCRVPLPTDDRRHHLIVELKRPSQPINADVLAQVRRYASAISLDDRFKGSTTEWDVVAISNSMTRDSELEASQPNRPSGLVSEYENPKVRIWAKTWGQLINESEGRLTFFKRGLAYQANDSEALKYLNAIDAKYLSNEIKAKIKEAELGWEDVLTP